MNADYLQGFDAARREIEGDGWTAQTARRFLADVAPYAAGHRDKDYDDGFRAALTALVEEGTR